MYRILLIICVVIFNYSLIAQTSEIDSLRVVVYSSTKKDSSKINQLYKYHKAYLKDLNYDSLKAIVNKAESIALTIEDKESIARVSIMKGLFFAKKQRFNESNLHLLRASRLIRNTSNTSLKLLVNTNLGNNYFKIGYAKKDLDSCKFYHKKSLELNSLDFNQLSDVYSRLSQAFSFNGQFDSALVYNGNIFNLANENNNFLYLYYKSQYSLYRSVKNKDSVFKYMRLCYKHMSENKDSPNYKSNMLLEYERYGISYYDFNNYDSALVYFDSCRKLSLELNNIDIFNRVFPVVSYIYSSRGENMLALELVQTAIDFGHKLGDSALIASSLNASTYIYDGLGEYEKGIEINKELFNNYFPYLSYGHQSSAHSMRCNLYGKIHDNENTLKYAYEAYSFNPTYINALNLGDALMFVYKDTSISKREVLPNYFVKESIGNSMSEEQAQDKVLELSKDYYQKSLGFMEESKDYRSSCHVYYGLAEYFQIKKQESQALFYYEKAWGTSSQNTVILDDKLKMSNRLYELNKGKGNISEALKWLEIRDSLEVIEISQNDLAELGKKQAEFEYSQKIYADSLDQKERDLEVKYEQEQQKLKLEAEQTKKYYLYASLILLGMFLFILYRRFQLAINQKKVIEKQKESIDQKRLELRKTHEGVKDSINYSRRIQKAIFPSGELFKELFPKSFIFFEPKDVVSGDFYWYAEAQGRRVFVTADCTGHGVPGAFMTIIGINLIQEILQEGVLKTDEILLEINARLIDRLSQYNKTSVKDGMDLSLCVIDDKMIEFAGAHLPLYHVTNGELIEYKGSNLFLGSKLEQKSPKVYYIPYQKGDIIYMSTDGLPDQKGGEKGKKYYAKRLREFLLANSSLPMNEQKQKLEELRENWLRGQFEQLDDITVVGVKL